MVLLCARVRAYVYACAIVRVCVCVRRGGGQRGMPFEQQVVIETKQELIREASGNS